MDIRNRMADVVALRTHALQDFLRMVLKDNWKECVYSKIKAELNGPYHANYIAAYEKIRDIGIDNYSVDDMDVSFIMVVIKYCGATEPIKTKINHALLKLNDDRKEISHSNENEDAEELYLMALLDLINLRSFVNAVDMDETNIDDAARLSYRQKYVREIEDLKCLIDEERIELVQKRKSIDRDIERILASKNRIAEWERIHELYLHRATLEKKWDDYTHFMLAASDAGISEAHLNAADCLIIRGEHQEAEKRITVLSNRFIDIPKDIAKQIVMRINNILQEAGCISDDLKLLIQRLQNQGYPIIENEKGFYIWQKR